MSYFDLDKLLTVMQSTTSPNFVAKSQLLKGLYSLQDYDVMTSRRRYVIERLNYDPANRLILVKPIIPPNFMAISQLLRELYDLQDCSE